MMARVIDLSPDEYRSSPLHLPERNWYEGNCYTDLWISVLHALKLEPLACLGPTLACAYGADQWTFCKPAHGDLMRLYGVVVDEMTVWKPVLEHCQTHVEAKQIPLIEVDAFYLPDTQQTDYRQNHSKTTIAVNALDREGKKLEYFHNAGYFALQNEDFDGVFNQPPQTGNSYLPPYCETVKLDRLNHRPSRDVKVMARHMTRACFDARSIENPIKAFSDSLDESLTELVARDEPYFHAWVFATLRQLGTGFELASLHLRWLAQSDDEPLLEAAVQFEKVAGIAKMLVMKTARMAMSGKVKPLSDPLLEMEASLEVAYAQLEGTL